MTKVVVVLGFNKTGSSLVAKSLSGEIPMGLGGWKPGIEDYHYYEDATISKLNGRILAAAGGSWADPPPENAILDQGEHFCREIKETVEWLQESSDHPQQIWGWKHPSTSLTIRLFHQYLWDPHYVPVFRNPKAVADSMHRRNVMQADKALRVCREYNKRILRFLEDFGVKEGI